MWKKKTCQPVLIPPIAGYVPGTKYNNNYCYASFKELGIFNGVINEATVSKN